MTRRPLSPPLPRSRKSPLPLSGRHPPLPPARERIAGPPGRPEYAPPPRRPEIPAPPRTAHPSTVARIVDAADSTLLDVVDNLLNRGVVVNADVMLALAGVDLVYLRLSLLLCAADRIMNQSRSAVPDSADVGDRENPRRSSRRRRPRRRRRS